MPHLNTSRYIYVTVLEDLLNTAQMFTQRTFFYSPPYRGDTIYVFPNMVRHRIFLSHALGIRPITTHGITGQSEHTMLFRTMSFVKIDAFQKGRAERSSNNVRYVKNYVFVNLKPCKYCIMPNTQNNLIFSIMTSLMYNNIITPNFLYF